MIRTHSDENGHAKAKHEDRYLLLIVLALLVFISLSEYLSTTLKTVQIGLVGHGLALLALLLMAAFLEDPKGRRIYLTLAFAPLIRLVSLSLPLGQLPMMYWYLLVGVPITFAVVMVARYGGFKPKEIGLTGNHWFLQVLFGLAGIGLGYVEYLILRPGPLVEAMTFSQMWLPALILIVFTGILEEVIFRGMMQTAFAEKLGRWLGLVLISILFAVLHLGYQSLLDVVFVFAVAILFGVFTELTGSILGVSIAHGLTNVTLFLIFPFIIGQGIQPLGDLPFFSAQPIRTGIPTSTVDTQTILMNTDDSISSSTPSFTQTPTIPLEITEPTITELPIPSPTLTATEKIPPIIVDDTDPGFEREGVERWESWQGYQGSLLWTFTRFDEPDMFVVWTPEIEHCGQYQFEVYIPEDYGQAHAVVYQVIHREGLDEIEVNQEDHQGEWVSLGAFWCEVNSQCQVSADNLMDMAYPTSFVAYDALRLTLLQHCN
jgi:membrane protease YdiL (CAAX protease family)